VVKVNAANYRGDLIDKRRRLVGNGVVLHARAAIAPTIASPPRTHHRRGPLPVFGPNREDSGNPRSWQMGIVSHEPALILLAVVVKFFSMLANIHHGE